MFKDVREASQKESRINKLFTDYIRLSQELDQDTRRLRSQIRNYNYKILPDFLFQVEEKTGYDLAKKEEFQAIEGLGVDVLNWELLSINKSAEDFKTSIRGLEELEEKSQELRRQEENYQALKEERLAQLAYGLAKIEEWNDWIYRKTGQRALEKPGQDLGDIFRVEKLEEMDIFQFRKYVYDNLLRLDILIEPLYEEMDHGIDFIVNMTYGLKVKNYSRLKLEPYAVQEAYIQAFIRGIKPVIITTGGVATIARERAQDLGVELISLEDILNIGSRDYGRDYPFQEGFYELIREKYMLKNLENPSLG